MEKETNRKASSKRIHVRLMPKLACAFDLQMVNSKLQWKINKLLGSCSLDMGKNCFFAYILSLIFEY